jgi:hypothetical protein
MNSFTIILRISVSFTARSFRRFRPDGAAEVIGLLQCRITRRHHPPRVPAQMRASADEPPAPVGQPCSTNSQEAFSGPQQQARACERRRARLAELGFATLEAYLQDRSVGRGWSVRRLCAELGAGHEWIDTQLQQVGLRD